MGLFFVFTLKVIRRIITDRNEEWEWRREQGEAVSRFKPGTQVAFVVAGLLLVLVIGQIT